jgi:hypothetical protein
MLYCSYSSGKGGRGPTRLMSPTRTFHNCGSSARLYFRRNFPSGVIRGSFLILKRIVSNSSGALIAIAGPIRCELDLFYFSPPPLPL